MRQRLGPRELQSVLRAGLLSFPLTDFDPAGGFDPRAFRDRLDWLNGFGLAGQFIAGGAGEFFSLTADEVQHTLRVAIEARPPEGIVIGAVGYGTRQAVALSREAEARGADGLLLLPPYLTEVSQAGLAEHIATVCAATGLGVIVYNRANVRLSAKTLARIADRCPNLVALKDGIGDTEELLRMRTELGDRLAFINGMPTAEIYAQSYYGMGIATYSSAILNFLPEKAIAFHRAVLRRDEATINGFLRDFLLPYSRIRARQPGYAVSIVKAGAAIVGRSAGPVRPPLSELTADEFEELQRLIDNLDDRGAPQIEAAAMAVGA